MVLWRSVKEFVYLGSLQSTDIGPATDIMRHIGIAAGSMRKLDNIWLSRKINIATNVKYINDDFVSNASVSSVTGLDDIPSMDHSVSA